MSQSLFQRFQPLAAIATTPEAATTLTPICDLIGATLWVPPALDQLEGTQIFSGRLADHLKTLWPDHRGFIFGLATGAVVRLIAPLLTHKSQDPAVVVVDQTGRFVISLCSGHQGGADQLAQMLATTLGATPVITGAAHAGGLPSIDTLGFPWGWRQGRGDWNGTSGLLARCQPIQVIQDAGSRLWQSCLPQQHPFQFHQTDQAAPQAKLYITHLDQPPTEELPSVQWHPQVLWVGIGCERGTSKHLMETAIRQVFQEFQLAIAAIAGIASLDLKADETGLVQLCQEKDWSLRCFRAETLKTMEVPTPSSVVAAAVGTPSVAEAAALKAVASVGLTPELPGGRLIVPKQIHRLPDQPGAVTVAVAQAAQELTGRDGQLLLVGTGPGAMDQMTPAAQTAVCQADVVIGYSLYIDLLRSQLRPGQLVEAYPITQERQRAQRAIALAQWGLTVAVISSGDAGIYGMAGLVLELLKQQGWDGYTPAVQIFPGVSAVQAAAARVGTPLMHDFCTISLSDHLTPWPVIEQRLEAAARADFVTALYNPRSQIRVEQFQKAQAIFLQHREGNTPVAVVRSAYRADEQIQLTTLDQLHRIPVDMLTTVLIGNRSTCFHHGWMITPRGYLDPVI